jgi:hypothetical protein
MLGFGFKQSPKEFEFDDLLNGKSPDMQYFVEQLEANGWAILNFSEEFKKKTKELGSKLEKEFFVDLEPHKKREFRVSEYLGYHEVMGIEAEGKDKDLPFKEKLTYVTGKTNTSQSDKEFPTKDLKSFISETDELTKKLCSVLAGPLFKCDNVSQLSSQIPLLDSDPEKVVML